MTGHRWIRPWVLAPLLILGALTAFHPEAIGRDRRDPYEFLRLPRDRADRVRELQRRIDRENRQLRERLEDRRGDLERLYRSYRFDDGRAGRLRAEVRQTQYELLELHHRFQVELRQHLTRREFDRLQRRLRDDDD
jgi:hypothetical protein